MRSLASPSCSRWSFSPPRLEIWGPLVMRERLFSCFIFSFGSALPGKRDIEFFFNTLFLFFRWSLHGRDFGSEAPASNRFCPLRSFCPACGFCCPFQWDYWSLHVPLLFFPYFFYSTLFFLQLKLAFSCFFFSSPLFSPVSTRRSPFCGEKFLCCSRCSFFFLLSPFKPFGAFGSSGFEGFRSTPFSNCF